MSKKVIKIMKRRMSLKERERFIKECERQNGKNFFKKLNGHTLENFLLHENLSFAWRKSKYGAMNWLIIKDRFSPKELRTRIKL